MTKRMMPLLTAALALAGLGLAVPPAHAQSVTAAFEDFSGHSKEPVHIEADRLDVRQSDQAAIFSGRVVVVQGKSTLRSKQLTIEYYDTSANDVKNGKDTAKGTKGTADAKGAPDRPTTKVAGSTRPTPAKASAQDGGAKTDGNAQQLQPSSRDIRRLIAVGDVVVTSGDQRATGNRGIFDMASNTVTLTGNVVLTQGENVLRGNKLVVDLTSQHSRLESSGSGGRVQGIFVPGQSSGTNRRGGAK